MRFVAATALVLVTSLALAAPALASDNGEGLLGETTDKTVTFFAFGVLVFITVFVTVMSIIQSKLDKRKTARKAVELRRRVGW
jgi:hypothetical protein